MIDSNLKKFSSESVSEGHPDKLADQISDAVLDSALKMDSKARVACETLLTNDLIVVTGEISGNVSLDIDSIVRAVLQRVGYVDSKYGLDYKKCRVEQHIQKQSADISEGISGDVIGAGDQGLMFGYAIEESEHFMPYPIVLAHNLVKKLSQLRKENIISYLGPDAKAQVTMEYDEMGVPVHLDNIVISTQHLDGICQKQLAEDLKREVIEVVIPEQYLTNNTKYYINPAGRFVMGGPFADTGLTGRKIIVDSYGGFAKHGGGAFSGKDATKVDRSAAYMARYIAKNLVAAGLCKKCEIQIAYAIGMSLPVSVHCDSFGTAIVSDRKLEKIVLEVFDLSPKAIIKSLDLNKPIYEQTACYGHFGRPEFSWERLDKIETLKKMI